MVQTEFVETVLAEKLIWKSHSHELRFHRQTSSIGKTDLFRRVTRTSGVSMLKRESVETVLVEKLI